MAFDVVDLREFYVSPLGKGVRSFLRARLRQIWCDVEGEDVLALGYATPLMRPWLETAKSIVAMMPDWQGGAYWPKEGPNVTCLVNLLNLPLEDEAVSRVVMLHALENTRDAGAFLREVWRVMKPEGRAILIVPNRRGLWAHSDSTPFGTGQPYSASQLKDLLREQGFYIERSYQALFGPPRQFSLAVMFTRFAERVGRFLPIICGGVHVVEVGKQIYSPTLVGAKKLRPRLVVPLAIPKSSMPTSTQS